MKIIVNIEADSVEEAKAAFAELAGERKSAALQVAAGPAEEKEPEKIKATRKKADPAPIADPLATAPAPSIADPLAAAPTVTTGDPLAAQPVNTSVASTDPLAATTTPPAPTVAQSGEITLATIREKIGTLGDKKQKVKDLVATYKKADGTPCEKPSDLQEKDYPAVFEDLDYV